MDQHGCLDWLRQGTELPHATLVASSSTNHKGAFEG